MKCQGIREKLDGYLEGSVSPEEKQWIEKHLDSCEPCQGALRDLAKTRDLLGNLEEVEPPAWMTRKIMARLAQESERRRGIFQRLFYPLHIKVPIEALAMVFIAVIAVYVYRAVEPEIKQVAVPPSAPSPVTEEKASRADEKTLSPGLADEPLAAKKKQASEEGYREEKREAGRVERKELLASKAAPQEIPKRRETMAFSAADKEVQEPIGRAAAPKMERGGVEKTGPFVIRLSVQKNEAAWKQIEEILMQLEAREIKDPAGAKGKQVTAEIKGGKLRLFLQRLEEIGEIREKDLPAEIPEGNMAIRIELVTAP